MSAVLYILFAWFLTCLFIFSKKSISPLQNVILFMFISIIIINSFTIFGHNLKWIKVQSDTEYFIAYTLFRSFIYPLAILFSLNLIVSKHYLYALTILLYIFSLEVMGKYLQIYHYIKWNDMYTILEITVVLSLGWVMHKLLVHIKRQHNYDYV
ncbi:hypothetical protein EJF36_03335 [Bacillus sp. HMF5848]|uniref:hypothetical protein n=1 Tax=Bacillus sp. HMF5848 TaxID=2495421 RepID=UPI000F775CBF|nr:hypothetical protein [Bacillus sp. HMF5848]RSK26008.1 hypothetical protein EJF36_03335 [Bacillus sp. HMF5848]